MAVGDDRVTVLNPGTGGSEVDEVEVASTAGTGGVAKRTRVAVALTDGKNLTGILENGETKLHVKDSSANASVLRRNNAFATLINAQPSATTDEIRLDDVSAGDLYLGRAADGTVTSAASWEVVRIYRSTTGVTTRIRYRSGISWDNRALAGNWP